MKAFWASPLIFFFLNFCLLFINFLLKGCSQLQTKVGQCLSKTKKKKLILTSKLHVFGNFTLANDRDVWAFFFFLSLPCQVSLSFCLSLSLCLCLCLSVYLSLSLFLSLTRLFSGSHFLSLSLSLIHMHTQNWNFMWTIILLRRKRRESFFHFPGALLSVSSCPSLALTFLLCLFLSSSPTLPLSFSLSLSLPPPPSLSQSLSLALQKKPQFLPFKRGSLSSPLVCSKRKKEIENYSRIQFLMLFPISCAALFFFFFL